MTRWETLRALVLLLVVMSAIGAGMYVMWLAMLVWT